MPAMADRPLASEVKGPYWPLMDATKSKPRDCQSALVLTAKIGVPVKSASEDLLADGTYPLESSSKFFPLQA